MIVLLRTIISGLENSLRKNLKRNISFASDSLIPAKQMKLKGVDEMILDQVTELEKSLQNSLLKKSPNALPK